MTQLDEGVGEDRERETRKHPGNNDVRRCLACKVMRSFEDYEVRPVLGKGPRLLTELEHRFMKRWIVKAPCQRDSRGTLFSRTLEASGRAGPLWGGGILLVFWSPTDRTTCTTVVPGAHGGAENSRSPGGVVTMETSDGRTSLPCLR